MTLLNLVWEVNFITLLQSFESSITTMFMTFMTLCGEEYIPIVIVAMYYYWIDKEKGKNLGLTILTTLYLTPMIKGFVTRKRPYFTHSEIKCLKKPNDEGEMFDLTMQGYSFPSMHAAVSMSFYGKLITYLKSNIYKILLVILIFLIGLSRNYLGVHYPTDVICGWALGLIVISLVGLLLKKIKNKKIIYLIIFLLGIAGVFITRDYEYYSALGMISGFLLGLMFEEKFVNFKMPNKKLKGLLRVIGALVIFALFKIIFDKIIFMIVQDTSLLFLYLTSIKYAICTFTLFGLYPLLFKTKKN